MASPRDMDIEVGEAISAFKSGRPVMIYDSDYREMETDLLWHAAAATPEVIEG